MLKYIIWIFLPIKDKEERKIYNRLWAREKARKNPNYQKTYLRKVRLRVLEKIGGHCVYCGCDIQEALEINHINGGG